MGRPGGGVPHVAHAFDRRGSRCGGRAVQPAPGREDARRRDRRRPRCAPAPGTGGRGGHLRRVARDGARRGRARGGPSVRRRLLRRRRLADRGAPLRRPRQGRRRDGADREPVRRDRGHALPHRGRAGGREAPRSDARAVAFHRAVARAARRAPVSRSSRSSSSRRPTTSSSGSHARAAREPTPSGCASCSCRTAPTTAPRGRTTTSSSRHESRSRSGDHRRQRHEARRLGPDRVRGPFPRAAQPRLRHRRRRRRHPGEGRPGRRGHPDLRHGRRRRERRRREHVDDLRSGPLRARRDLRGGRRGDPDRDLHHRAHPGARDAARATPMSARRA